MNLLGLSAILSIYAFCSGLLFGLSIAFAVSGNYLAMSLLLIVSAIKSYMAIGTFLKIKIRSADSPAQQK